jgi:dihydroorotate dehydrogenase
MYRWLYRRALSRIDAETIHLIALHVLEAGGRVPAIRAIISRAFASFPSEGLGVTAFGLHFAHPLGVAAGFDKEGRALPALAALGFSFVEVGTVTPQPQPGNPRPRVFRLYEDDALINRMGFPSAGMESVARRLARRDPAFPTFVSIGKNKATPLTDAARDYALCLVVLYSYGDAFVVNVSSPNTPELRQLQTRAYLADLLGTLTAQRDQLALTGIRKPLLVKIAPDLDDHDLAIMIDTALTCGVDGMIAANTTIRRDGLASPNARESGGLSGRPLLERTLTLIRAIHAQAGTGLPIIGVGGVFDGDDLRAVLAAGAILAQAYTGFIYGGMGFVGRTLKRYQTA